MELQAPSSDVADLRLAERLRALRRARSWSLDELSVLSGVSRASLSRIENGEVSPTASVLGRLAGAHRTTVSRLLADIEGDAPALVRRGEQPEWVDPATGFRRRSVSPPSLSFDCELLCCELPAGARIDYPFRRALASNIISISWTALWNSPSRGSSIVCTPATAFATS
ncbi:MAG TPA: helix-turn-helix transcriptional regulator [Roseiarcus sp.]